MRVDKRTSRYWSIGIALLSLLLCALPSTRAEAARKVGATCLKVNKKVIKAGEQLICKKKGKKLVWHLQKKKSTTASLQPATEHTPTTTLFELVRPKVETAITWSTVVDRRNESAGILYADARETVKRNRSLPNIKIDYRVFLGPSHDSSHFSSMDIWLEELFAFYARAVKPDSYVFLAFPFQDLEWAVEQLSRPDINIPGYEVVLRNANPSINQGFRQNAIPDMKPGRFDGIWLLPANLSGTREMPTRQLHEKSTFYHEYGHQIQQAQWKDEDLNGPNLGMGRDAPCFLQEGIVTIPELALVINSAEEYMQNLKSRIRGAYTSDPTTRDELGNFTGYAPLAEDITYDFALRYIDNSFEPNCDSGLQYGLSYSLGYLATEALAVIGGVESPMALFTLMGRDNLSWDRAFEMLYGITWIQARPILANYIYSQANDYRG